MASGTIKNMIGIKDLSSNIVGSTYATINSTRVVCLQSGKIVRLSLEFTVTQQVQYTTTTPIISGFPLGYKNGTVQGNYDILFARNTTDGKIYDFALKNGGLSPQSANNIPTGIYHLEGVYISA